MKIKHNLFSGLVLGLVITLFYGISPAQTTENLLFDFQVSKLQERLQLTPEQAETVQKLEKMLQGQETLDHQNFGSNGLALIAAAMRRAQMAEFQLERILDDSQKLKLKALKDEQQKDKELFNLKEGLMLTADQIGKLKPILEEENKKQHINNIDYGDRFSGMGMGYPDMGGYGMIGQNPRDMPGLYPNQIPGQMYDQTAGGQMYGTRGFKDSAGDAIREQEAEKDKAIEKMLTPDQKKLFEQLKHERQKEIEQMLEKNRQNPGSSLIDK
ncbi:MAG: hypothetical protein ACM3SY_20585 [Candidatus Omnitrophota bacterium]